MCRSNAAKSRHVTCNSLQIGTCSESDQLTQPYEWKHVPTQDNPADFSSRGQMPKEFAVNSIWQQGPHWLNQDEGMWPQLLNEPIEISETRNARIPQVSMKIITSERSDLFQGFNSFHLFTRAIAHCRRFCHNASSKNNIKLTGPLSDIEIKTARDCIIKITQETAFATEINCLSRNQDIDRKSFPGIIRSRV